MRLEAPDSAAMGLGWLPFYRLGGARGPQHQLGRAARVPPAQGDGDAHVAAPRPRPHRAERALPLTPADVPAEEAASGALRGVSLPGSDFSATPQDWKGRSC